MIGLRSPLPEISKDDFSLDWHQGEHVTLIGSTGTGKTTQAHSLLEQRDFVCVLAVKRFDDTIERFKNGPKYGLSRYAVIHKWPPECYQHKVIFWPRPKDIKAGDKQSTLIYHAVNDMYMSGGWCIYFDEAGYISGSLGLGSALGVLLNQGRSSHISVMATMTRPRSMIARVPVEALNQCRHILIFKYSDEREIRACAEIAGISYLEMKAYQQALRFNQEKGFSDFIYIGKNRQIVRTH